MIVCHCRVVNHRDIEAAVDGGARTVPEVAAICGAGTDCGGVRAGHRRHRCCSAGRSPRPHAPSDTGVGVAA